MSTKELDRVAVMARLDAGASAQTTFRCVLCRSLRWLHAHNDCATNDPIGCVRGTS